MPASECGVPASECSVPASECQRVSSVCQQVNAVCKQVNASMPVSECGVPASACGVLTPLTLASEPVHNHLQHSTASVTQHTDQHTNQVHQQESTHQSRRTQHQQAHQQEATPTGVNTHRSCVPRCLSQYADRNPPTPAAADSKVADCCTQRQGKAAEHAGWLAGDLFLEFHL